MAKLDLTKYGISGTTEIVHNPSYDELFAEETKPAWKATRRAVSANWEPSML